MSFSNPLLLLFICAGFIGAIYGPAMWQKIQGRTKGLSEKFGRNRTDVAKWSSIGAIVLIANLALYLVMYYVGIYATTDKWPTFGFHAPIFLFLLVINILAGASYHLDFFGNVGPQPVCEKHGTNYSRTCSYCKALADNGLIKLKKDEPDGESDK